jgi:sugar phosphate isomerase/epimerase
MTRRTILTGLAAATASNAQQRKEWKPRLGVLGPFTESNVQFAKAEGFTNMILDGGSVTEEKAEAIKSAGMHFSAIQSSQNHISPDPDKHAKEVDYFVKKIELAGKLGIPYIGTCSGKDEAKRFPQQIDDIVRVYTEKYFKACEASKVRILWEPWAGGPNIATGPIGFEALFKAFGDSPYVGLQYDPSHLVWQMMDPIQCARDFVDKIYDVHLKDTQIRWDVLKKTGINPPNRAQWWSFRLPGLGSMDWPGFFSVLQQAGYQGAMSIEHEDSLYGAPSRPGPDFSDDFKTGLKMAHRYLKQYIPD